MADITCTAAQVAPVFPDEAEIFDFVAAAAITAGAPAYITSAGKVDNADANGSGTDTFRGIALSTVGAGQPVSVLKKGHVYGYTLSGAYDSLVYVSNTAGALADAAGGTSLIVGRVVPLSDTPNYTKVLYVQASWA